jgi:hypothetical protein
MPTKKYLKGKIMKGIIEKFMEKLQITANHKYKMHSRNFKTPDIKTWEDTETTKWIQKGLQQTPTWNEGDYRKEIYEIKKTTHIWKRNWTKIWKTSEKKSNRNPGDKSPLLSNKKQSGKPLQHTKISGRQNLKAWRYNRY